MRKRSEVSAAAPPPKTTGSEFFGDIPPQAAAVVDVPNRKAANEIGAKLVDAMKENSPEQQQLKDAQAKFRGTKDSPMRPDFERITETIFIDNAFENYKRLEDALRVGQKRNDHGSVNSALDESESNARIAHKLWMTAKLERERWELDNAQIFASMRHEATRILQTEKEQGKRTKQITDADVEATMALIFGDEWKQHELRRKKYRNMEDSMAHLNEMWISRCRSLQTMLSKSR